MFKIKLYRTITLNKKIRYVSFILYLNKLVLILLVPTILLNNTYIQKVIKMVRLCKN